MSESRELPSWVRERIARRERLNAQRELLGLEPITRADLDPLVERARLARERARKESESYDGPV